MPVGPAPAPADAGMPPPPQRPPLESLLALAIEGITAYAGDHLRAWLNRLTGQGPEGGGEPPRLLVPGLVIAVAIVAVVMLLRRDD